MSKFTEAKLEEAIIGLLGDEGYPHVLGETITRDPTEVLIKEDLKTYLLAKYNKDGITKGEIDSIIRRLETFSAHDLYESNKAIMKMVSDGFLLKREPVPGKKSKKDLYIQLIDYSDLIKQNTPKSSDLLVVEEIDVEAISTYDPTINIYKVVNQLEIAGYEKRIPDAILYINGIPLVVFEFKSAIREDATIHDAYVQITTRYRRGIPELFKYNAFCVISDGVNNRAGSFFADYEFFNSWRKVDANDSVEKDGIDSLLTMIQGMFNKYRLRDIIRNFIYFPDTSKKDEKIVCRYPQYYAATKLYTNIFQHMRPRGDGKGGTYFGATGCGKSFTMLYLTRLIMKSLEFASPTIVLITDRTDLDRQLSTRFTNAKKFIGDEFVISVKSREHLRELLKGRNSGGVFLTTIHKFTEDTELLTERSNVICISDEAHRSQINLDQKITTTKYGVKKTYGFAKYLHDSLPAATYTGFTGTPIEGTFNVFGSLVEAYTMTDSVIDKITVNIIYEGRAAKVLLDNEKLQEIERYYEKCAEEGTSEYQIDESKKANANINLIIGDPDRLNAVAKDFVQHYDRRLEEGASVKGKAIFVCSDRSIAFQLYQRIVALRPQWTEKMICDEDVVLTDDEKRKIKPIERIKMVMTRDKDDAPELYKKLGTKEYRKDLDKLFKTEKSNFKIAIVVDMWLTGFDVPSLDTIYIDKPVQRHSLIQTISRVNRRFEGKQNGLVVDYIGIKEQMLKALGEYGGEDGIGGQEPNIEDIEKSVVIVKDFLDLLNAMFHKFDITSYFKGTSMQQLNCLNKSVEFVMTTEKQEKWFMYTVRRLKLAYDIACSSEEFSQFERDLIHFYLAVRSIIFKLTKGDSPDIATMNAKVQKMIEEALKSNEVIEIIKLCEKDGEIDIFDEKYMACISALEEPNTKMKLLMKLLKKAIDDFSKSNKYKAIEFTKAFNHVVERYNNREELEAQQDNIVNDFADEIINLMHALKEEKNSFKEMDIDFEEKVFYDILKALAEKYEFEYPDEKLIVLSKRVKEVVADKTRYTDWSKKDDIKAELKVDLILLLAEHNYPPVDREEVYSEVFEQAKNFKKHRIA